ncbi:MFS transporter [Microbacterium sp. RU33B]|uniref:MFS transporter n=1 Tax=Microbacterium sp. RU33B TaxID=1907390 RepID=UPI00095B3001|nr:MFS transporter [Microbacterium sp. RU33B]SIT72364.1 Predicted arabinose efflux permease, MFS family [Microbacterium sp. RU33B]
MTSEPREPLRTSAFRRYFSAVATSAFGTTLTVVALPVLVLEVLGGDAVALGIVNAAQLVPYALLGLVAGVYVDRWRRQRVLVWASLGRALTIALVPVLWWLGMLQLWVLVVLLVLFGGCAVFGFAATQSLLPQIVERRALLAANARLDQAETAAQTVGPVFGGWFVGWLGAPIALVIDAVTYVIDAVLIAGARLTESASPPAEKRSLRRDVGDGLRWTYRHRVLGPLAASTHVWFFANAAGFTTLAVLVLQVMDASPLVYGLLLAVGGVAALLGTLLVGRMTARLGSGRTIACGRLAYPLAWSAIAIASIGGASDASFVTVFAAFALQGFAGGIENANEMSLRQTMTPDPLLGRVNGTMRSANRTVAAVGAIVGGVTASAFGVLPALVGVAVVFAAAFAIAAASPVRTARLAEE